jgi:glycosyltransferase involved in cell wall biosynthesis
MERLGQPMPEAEWILFVPSRIDFFWKGTDLLLRALTRLPKKKDLHFIFSGWGTDYKKAREMILPHQATFLPCAVSKPILYDFFSAADVVVDQFRMGIYGTSAVEAMGCGAPVIMWIDKERFQTHGWDPPPILNGKNEEEIVEILGDILSGRVDLEKHAHAALDWVVRTHGEEVVLFSLKKILKKYLSSHPISAGN